MVAGLIFDKDGTLFDFNATWGAWSAAVIRTEAQGDPAMEDALATALDFDLTTHSFRQGSIVIAHTVDEIAAKISTIVDTDVASLKSRMIAAATKAPQVPATDLPALMARLRARDLKLGVATNDAEAAARAHLAQAGIGDAFDLVLGYDSGHGGKPAPGQLLAFCAAAGLAPADCVMIGDSTHDLDAAAAAGMRGVGVLTGPATFDALASFADVVLPDISHLPAWLDSLPA